MKPALFGQLRGARQLGRKLGAAILGTWLAVFWHGPALAEINADLADDYLKTQFDWAMFVEAKPVDHYLDYEGTRLRPLTNVRVFSRAFPEPAKVYEDLWYSGDALIGLRRRNKLNIKKGKRGIIAVGRTRAGLEHPQALANALVVLALHLQFQEIVVDSVDVPLEQYDRIAAGLASYRFTSQEDPPQEGRQMSIHLRSAPVGKEGYYYMR